MQRISDNLELIRLRLHQAAATPAVLLEDSTSQPRLRRHGEAARAVDPRLPTAQPVLEPLLANDFVVYGPEPASKEQMLEGVMDTSRQIEIVSHNEVRVGVLGSARDVALVTGSVTAKIRRKEQPATNLTNRYTEVWV